MNDDFYLEEKLYRAVLPNDIFWKNKYDKLSSAVFKDSKGLSVDRQMNRSDSDAIEFIANSKTGTIISVTCGNCNEAKALVRYLPVEGNEFHSEIHSNEEKKSLSGSQAKQLARVANIELIRS